MLGVSEASRIESSPIKPRAAVHIRLSQQLKEALLQAKACGLQATLRFGKDAQPNVRPVTPSCRRHLLTLSLETRPCCVYEQTSTDSGPTLCCSPHRCPKAHRHALQAIRVGDCVFEFTAHEESNCDLIRVPKDASASVVATDVGPITQRLYVKVPPRHHMERLRKTLGHAACPTAPSMVSSTMHTGCGSQLIAQGAVPSHAAAGPASLRFLKLRCFPSLSKQRAQLGGVSGLGPSRISPDLQGWSGRKPAANHRHGAAKDSIHLFAVLVAALYTCPLTR